MKDAYELRAALSQITGTDGYHYNRLYPKMNYTDGVRFFLHNAGGGAYWFLDIIGTEIFPIHQRGEDLVVIVLESKDGEALITANDGGKDGQEPKDLMPPKHIRLTDCPEGEWKFYIENGVLSLPGER
jgi:hypothetical protein